jgi:flagellar biosynthesis/type III secretory pathway protein FliH
MKDVDPAEVAAEMLKAALPGFESRINPDRDSLVIHGALPVAYEVNREVIYYPVYRRDVYRENPFARAVRDATEPDAEREIREAAERARQTEALKVELADLVAHIAENVQRFAIEAVGLEAVIAAREEKARDLGRREGFREGREMGAREGRAEGIREVARVLMTGTDLGDAIDSIREELDR